MLEKIIVIKAKGVLMNTLSYESIFYKVGRRLKRLQTYSNNEYDTLLFLILGNMNLRINTLFFLVNNSTFDGVFPLQRTIYEMNISFKVYIDANNKKEMLEVYKNKKGFELSHKISRFIKEEDSKVITDKESKKLEAMKKDLINELKSVSDKGIYKTWYEFASKKSLLELSLEYENISSYLYSYDLMSNWVHPQTMEENLSNDFQNYISSHNKMILYTNLLLSLKYLEDNLLLLCNYLGLVESNPIYEIGKELEILKIKIEKLRIENE
ncbi:hypothetical protein BW731_10680 [Vagococcus martis]|uniref:Uncharacterized protein n=1 Tax=Vagococcus martis TaxID=1768210 RepID=A0A1V4DJE1_9ENTE|nr:DUF5677 domain-containing protein [Vagococcus martis]OPF88598.1 hypothetical protein BW731_10680 [Vagococcus martis]